MYESVCLLPPPRCVQLIEGIQLSYMLSSTVHPFLNMKLHCSRAPTQLRTRTKSLFSMMKKMVRLSKQGKQTDGQVGEAQVLLGKGGSGAVLIASTSNRYKEEKPWYHL